MKVLTVITMFLVLGLMGCTDAAFQKATSFGKEHSVQCYSGELIIYSGVATGKVISEANSDGYFFKDKATGSLMEVSGNCVIKEM